MSVQTQGEADVTPRVGTEGKDLGTSGWLQGRGVDTRAQVRKGLTLGRPDQKGFFSGFPPKPWEHGFPACD